MDSKNNSSVDNSTVELINGLNRKHKELRSGEMKTLLAQAAMKLEQMYFSSSQTVKIVDKSEKQNSILKVKSSISDTLNQVDSLLSTVLSLLSEHSGKRTKIRENNGKTLDKIIIRLDAIHGIIRPLVISFQSYSSRNRSICGTENSFVQNPDAELVNNSSEFVENGSEFAKTGPEFLENGPEFLKNDTKFLENDSEFPKNDTKFLGNDSKYDAESKEVGNQVSHTEASKIEAVDKICPDEENTLENSSTVNYCADTPVVNDLSPFVPGDNNERNGESTDKVDQPTDQINMTDLQLMQNASCSKDSESVTIISGVKPDEAKNSAIKHKRDVKKLPLFICLCEEQFETRALLDFHLNPQIACTMQTPKRRRSVSMDKDKQIASTPSTARRKSSIKQTPKRKRSIGLDKGEQVESPPPKKKRVTFAENENKDDDDDDFESVIVSREEYRRQRREKRKASRASIKFRRHPSCTHELL